MLIRPFLKPVEILTRHMTQPSPLFLCITTVSSRDEAERIASQSVESQLAACAQIDSPIASVYKWQDKVEQDQEIRLSLYAVEANLEKLETLVHRIHPYDTPKWVCIPVEKVSEKYLKWANEVSNLRGFI